MEFASLDWVFLIMTVACAVLVIQIILDYNRRATQIRPLIREAFEIRSRHEDEIIKVQRLTYEAEVETTRLDREVTDLESQQKELEIVLEGLRE